MPQGNSFVLCVFGFIFLVIGVTGLRRVWRFYKKLTVVQGTVAGCKRVVKGRLVEFLPLVDYQFEGRTYHVLCRTGKPSRCNKGDTVELRLDPARPMEAEVFGEWRLFWACIYTVLGLFLFIFSFVH